MAGYDIRRVLVDDTATSPYFQVQRLEVIKKIAHHTRVVSIILLSLSEIASCGATGSELAFLPPTNYVF